MKAQLTIVVSPEGLACLLGEAFRTGAHNVTEALMSALLRPIPVAQPGKEAA